MAIAIIICVCSAIIYFMSYSPTNRAVLYFYSYDYDNLCTEVRHLPQNTVQGDEAFFVEELLLGPMTNRYKKLFADGTKLDFCIRQDDKLYVGLSKMALYNDLDAVSLRVGVETLKLNIVKQFTKINTVLVYIDGKSAW